MNFSEKTILGLLLAAAVSPAFAADSLPPPYPIARTGNLVAAPTFRKTVACGAKQAQYYAGKRIKIDGGLPARWQLRAPGNAAQTAGSLRVKAFPRGGAGALALDFPHNKYNAVEVVPDTPIPREALKTGTLHGGFWARGNGTVRFRLSGRQGTKQTVGFTEFFSVTDAWHFFRTRALSAPGGGGNVELSISVYGKVEIAFPEIAPLPAVDPAARLLFHAPFENSSPDARFSVGTVAASGMYAFPVVPGVRGKAIRIDRKRRFAADGQLIYPLGFCYDFIGDALDRHEGTVEFFYRPLPEMLQRQVWNEFPLFFLGDTSWQWADVQDFDLSIRPAGGKLKLVLNECSRVRRWPDAERLKSQKNSASFTIEDAAGFVNRWHHIAFTYDAAGRTVYLDGEPVIRMAALKSPAIMSRVPKLTFANAHLAHPAVASADLDELKIYSGVKYRGAFKPNADDVPDWQNVSGGRTPESAASLRLAAWSTGMPYLSGDRTRVVFPLTRGAEQSALEIVVADGAPVIFSARSAVVGIRTDYADLPRPLVLQKAPKFVGAPEAASAHWTLPDAAAECRAELRIENGIARLNLNIAKNSGEERVYLEPRVSFRNGGTLWRQCFDGLATREILAPFHPFRFSGLLAALPAAACWGGRSGTMLALTPETFCGSLERGMDSPDAMTLKVRTVLDRRDSLSLAFDCIPFDAKYAESGAVDRYHALHPEFFRLSPRVNPSVYGNITLTDVWNNPSYLKRAAAFSHAELARRTRSSWCWFYYNSPTPGNWSADPEFLSKLSAINLPRIGDGNYHDDFAKKTAGKHRALLDMGIHPALYISSWAERRMVRHYADSAFSPSETYNGIESWPQYWGRHAIDHIMLPSGTRYGVWLRRQLRRLLANDLECDIFAYDLCGYFYTFRKPNSLGGLRAFDENGAYVEHVTALGKLFEELKSMKTGTGCRPAVMANSDINLSGFPSTFRVENTIHEQQSILTLQARALRRRQTRLNGEKPTTYLMMPRLNGNFFGDEDARLLRYGAVSFHQNHVLMGMLYNIRQNDEIAGVRESMELLDELLRVQSLGYRQTCGASAGGALSCVRYGDPEHGVVAAVNLGAESKNGRFVFDAEYFGVTPLMAAAGREFQVAGGAAKLHGVPPLSWRVVELAGCVPGVRNLAYSSILRREPGLVEMEFTFQAPGSLAGLRVGNGKMEKLSVFLNRQPVSLASLGAVRAGDKLRLCFADMRYHSSADSLMRLPGWEKSGVIRIAARGKKAEAQAGRIAEFFRFTARSNGWKTLVSQKVPESEADILIEETSSAPGLVREANRTVIRGAAGELASLAEEYLKLLDRRYPWYGVFGKQAPTSPLDYAATGLQRAFMKRHGLVGQTASTAKAAAEFVAWRKEHNIDPVNGF